MEIATSEPQGKRAAYLGGLAIAIGGAILFSTKAIVAKLLYLPHAVLAARLRCHRAVEDAHRSAIKPR
jgi:hypothetical protein